MGCSSSNTINEIVPTPQKETNHYQDYKFQSLKEKFQKFQDIATNLNPHNVHEAYKKNKSQLSELNISEEEFVEATLNELAQNEMRNGIYENLNVNEYMEVLLEFGIAEEDLQKFIESLKPTWRDETKCLVLKSHLDDPLNSYYFSNLKYNSEYSDLNLMNFMTAEKIKDILKSEIAGTEQDDTKHKRQEFYKQIGEVAKLSKSLETILVGIESRSDDDTDRFTTNGDFFVPIFDAVKYNSNITAFGVINVGNVSYDLSINGQKSFADAFNNKNLMMAATTLINLDVLNFNQMIKNIQNNVTLKGILFISEALKNEQLVLFLNTLFNSIYLKGGVIGAIDVISQSMKDEINRVKNMNGNIMALAICDKETVHNI